VGKDFERYLSGKDVEGVEANEVVYLFRKKGKLGREEARTGMLRQLSRPRSRREAHKRL
jgi:hypothetical protein